MHEVDQFSDTCGRQRLAVQAVRHRQAVRQRLDWVVRQRLDRVVRHRLVKMCPNHMSSSSPRWAQLPYLAGKQRLYVLTASAGPLLASSFAPMISDPTNLQICGNSIHPPLNSLDPTEG